MRNGVIAQQNRPPTAIVYVDTAVVSMEWRRVVVMEQSRTSDRSVRSRRRHTYLSNPFAHSVVVPRDKEISRIFYDVNYYLLFTTTVDMFLLVCYGLRPLPHANHAQCTQCHSCLLDYSVYFSISILVHYFTALLLLS